MDNDTSLMESEFLPPAADLEQLIGTLLFAINAQVEADESRTELSLAAWQQWLDEEGYPIHEAIEQFCKYVTIPHQSELNAIKSELMARLHDPSGLSVLSGVVDAQQPEIAENLHAFIERATAKAQETYAIAGGTHIKAIYGGSVVGLFLVGGIAYKRRSARIERELLEFEVTARDAIKQTFQNIDEEAERKAEEERENFGNRSLQYLGSWQLTPGELRNARQLVLNGAPGIHSIKIALKKDLKEFSKFEIDRQVMRCTDVFAEASVKYMEEHEAEGFKLVMDFLQSHFKKDLLEKSGRGEELVVLHYPGVNEEAEKQAREAMQILFANKFKTSLQNSFRFAENKEAKQIDLAFHDAYKKAIADILDVVGGGEVGRKIRSALDSEEVRVRDDADEYLYAQFENTKTDVVQVEKEVEKAVEF